MLISNFIPNKSGQISNSQSNGRDGSKLTIFVLTILVLMMCTTGSWGSHINFVDQSNPKNTAWAGKDRINGTMTRITAGHVTIDEKQYNLSPDAVIQYADGGAAGISDFRAIVSAKINARIDKGIITEIIIEELVLRD